MNSQLAKLFDEPDKGYLSPQTLNSLSQYVSSVPTRLSAYRQLRDQELTLMQKVADHLQQTTANVSNEALEQSLKNGLLILRYCAMAMLLDDVTFAQHKLDNWLPPMVEVFQTQALDLKLQAILRQFLGTQLTPEQMALLQPSLDVAQQILSQSGASQSPQQRPLAAIS